MEHRILVWTIGNFALVAGCAILISIHINYVRDKLQGLINTIAGLMEHNEKLMDRISSQELDLQSTVTELVGLKQTKEKEYE